MIEQLFRQTRAPFIVVRDGQLHVNGCAHDELTIQIHEILPVRKLFRERKLKCYSLDCQTGKNGRFCELCADRRRCGRRLQLRLVYQHDRKDHPAILEIPQRSFPAFEKLLTEAGAIEKLHNALVQIIPTRTPGGHTELHFQLLF